jgi:hypothetical protein
MNEIVLLPMNTKTKISNDRNYMKSVSEIKRVVLNWGNIYLEILHELYDAKNKLL